MAGHNLVPARTAASTLMNDRPVGVNAKHRLTRTGDRMEADVQKLRSMLG